ncbi:MAG TPA: branched-chain amino acid ABC transporter substrate-binding protein [Thermoleophilaceae bacterium]|nr:branched-chain amino acid ABC transporter substrate-binding protein [Thermoleophilaceae bacterium]
MVVLSCLLGAFALGMTACGDDDDDDGGGGDSGGGGGSSVTVYSSLPLQGASRPQTTALVDGIKLALKEAGGKAGNITVKYTSLDDSTAQAGTWTPEATSANARKVAQDDSAIAYIGEFNSGASAISIPILNEVPILQLSPANTAVGLTTDEPGADEGEPEKYYPTGSRHYMRIVPKDTIQGAALASLMKKDGCGNAYILNDKEVYGAGLSRNIESAAKEIGLEILANEGIDPKAPNFRSQAATMKSDGAECFVFSGITANGAVQLYKDVAAALPDAQLYGPDGVAESGFADPKEGGVPVDVGNRIKVSVATLAPDEYPPDGKKFFSQFEKEYGEPNPDPYSIYGFEAMDLFLDTCKKLADECTDRQAVIDAMFQTKGRESVLGTYDIDENGDTTLTDYGIYQIKNGELEFDETIQAAGG